MLRLVMMVSLVLATMAISCDEASQKCAFRTGCGNALQGYVLDCSFILREKPMDHCPEECQNALIALTSTNEGKELMTCECSDEVCTETKEKVEICRPQVIQAVKNDTSVSCDAAQWICAADATCLKALEYYHQYCKYMFSGKRCSYRCKNSITILRKQEKAAKLDSCWCSGREEYDCTRIRANMDKLCFNKTTVEIPRTTDTPDVDNDVLRSIASPPFEDVENIIGSVPTTTDKASSLFTGISLSTRVFFILLLPQVTKIVSKVNMVLSIRD